MSKPQSRPSPKDTATSSGELLGRHRAGDDRALSALFRRQGIALKKWAHLRLPGWARRALDTTDLVQEALLQTFRRINQFEDRGKGALQAYLRQAVDNRIRDEVRRVVRRPIEVDSAEAAQDIPARGPSAFDETLDAEYERLYKDALTTLTDDERVLVVGRLELGYSYEQLALVSRRATAQAARVAVRRAVLKVARGMPDA